MEFKLLGDLIFSFVINYFFSKRYKKNVKIFEGEFRKEKILNLFGVKLWRSVMKQIPFPFDGVGGYNRMTKELGGNIVMAFSF